MGGAPHMCPGGGWGHGETLGWLSGSRCTSVFGEKYLSGSVWLVCSWNPEQKIGKLLVINQVLAVLSAFL